MNKRTTSHLGGIVSVIPSGLFDNFNMVASMNLEGIENDILA